MSSSKVQNLTELAEAPASGDLLIVWDVSENDGDGTPGKPKKITSANAHAGYQPLDALLTAIAALSMVADRYIYGTGTDTVALGTITAFARTLLDDVDQAAARTTLALTPGTDVQAYSAQLAAIAALSPSNDDIIQRKAGAWTNRTIAQLLSDLGLSALYQPLDADLTAIAALVSAADKLAYATGAGTWSLTDLTSFARTLLDDANQAAARTTLGLTPGTDVQAYSAVLTALTGAFVAASASGPATLAFAEDTDNGSNKVTVTAPASLASDCTATLPSATGTLATTTGAAAPPTTLTFILSDETTVLTTGTKLTYEIPFAFTITAVTGSLTASGTGTTVDIKESGTTIFTNKIVFDSGETSITTAATPPSLADSSIAANAVLTFIVDATAGNAAGLKVSLTGYKT